MMSHSRKVPLWTSLLLAAAIMVGADSAPAEAHGDGLVNGPTGGRHGNAAGYRDRALLNSNRRFDNANRRQLYRQTRLPPGARIEVFVDGRLVYSRQANARVPVNSHSGMVRGNGRMVQGNGKGQRLVTRSGRRPVSGNQPLFIDGDGGLVNDGGARSAKSSGRRLVRPSRAGDGVSTGGY